MVDRSLRPAASPSAGDFLVDDWLVQPRLNLISKDTVRRQVEPKVMAVLVCLAKQPGAVLSRAQLHETVWERVVVSDSVLTRAVSELRKVFDDDARNPRVIETVSKTGYRLIGPVSYPSLERDNGTQAGTPGVAERPSRPTGSPAKIRWASSHVVPAAVLLLVLGGLVVFVSRSLQPATLSAPVVVPLTTTPGLEVNPSLSPDGRLVAFAWQGSTGGDWDVYVKQPGTEPPLRLTDHPADEVRPVWSPDGRYVAFLRYEGDTCAVMRVPALGGPERRLAACTAYPMDNRALEAPPFDWSPDGAWLAITARPSAQEPFSIYLHPLATNEARRLTTPPPSYLGDVAPAFSPDGKRVAFARARPSGLAELYVVDLDGGEERRLTVDGQFLSGHDWTPDGRKLVFSSTRGSTFALWEAAASGGEPAWIPLAGLNLESPSLAASAGLVYEDWIYDLNISRLALAAGIPEAPRASSLSIASTAWDMQPAYAPDGATIAFVSNRSGNLEIWKSAADGTAPVQLSSFEGAVVGHPRWAPDGQALVFEARFHGTADLYRLDPAGGVPQRLTDAPGDESRASWSPDGAWIYFASDRTGTYEIWRIAPTGGASEQVTTHGGYDGLVSSDSRYLYYTKHETPGLWRMDARGGAEVQVSPFPAAEDAGNWVLDARGLYFVARSLTANPTLSFYDFATGATRVVQPLRQAPPMHLRGLARSPDGQWLLYTQLDHYESNLHWVAFPPERIRGARIR